ncbi:FixH family protein [Rubinisphaera sp.]|uniref:FixH family protein n=1 Tax=Rubinisphaera sp. TaxID=2024857 RepID=UPI000C0E8F9C|nr:FixH family protein [Rubinisphaera sp.]MBV12164.1 hypothetical protein [Rubinisphaera sp.]HCS54308.1 hypothetical protein [Planctomycetaceae bacterium]|tara:strand:- start:11496 stop:12023 length:528 start_codon:yes stop_codon:yes gene_type:complete
MQITGTIDESAEQAERKSRWIWSGMIVGLLSLQIFCCMIAFFLATTSTSMAVIPDYHQKALNWDETRNEQQTSELLGWKKSIDVSEPIDVYGNRTVTVWLNDSTSAPVSADHVSLKAYRHANAAQLISIPLEEIAPGTYQAQAEIMKAGLWQFELQANRESDSYVESFTLDIATR